MHTRNRLGYGVALMALTGLGFLGWSRTNPASAQNGGNVTGTRQEFRTSTGNGFASSSASSGGSFSGGSNGGSQNGGGFGGSGGGMMLGSSGIAANEEYVYVLRGNTVVQMRADDLTIVKSQELPSGGGSGTTNRRVSNGFGQNP